MTPNPEDLIPLTEATNDQRVDKGAATEAGLQVLSVAGDAVSLGVDAVAAAGEAAAAGAEVAASAVGAAAEVGGAVLGGLGDAASGCSCAVVLFMLVGLSAGAAVASTFVR